MLHQKPNELSFLLYSDSSQCLKVFALTVKCVSLDMVLNPAALFVQPWAAFLSFSA